MNRKRRKPKQIINLTGHSIHIIQSGHVIKAIPPCGTVVRCNTVRKHLQPLGIVPVYRTIYEPPIDLPASRPDVVYLVSNHVLNSAPHRLDLYAPTDLVHDNFGRVVGCKGLKKNMPPVGVRNDARTIALKEKHARPTKAERAFHNTVGSGSPIHRDTVRSTSLTHNIWKIINHRLWL